VCFLVDEVEEIFGANNTSPGSLNRLHDNCSEAVLGDCRYGLSSPFDVVERSDDEIVGKVDVLLGG